LTSAPFISKAIQLLVWKPSVGVYSLAQRFAGSVCGHAKTREECEQIAKKVDEEKRRKIEKVVEKSKCASTLKFESYYLILKNGGVDANETDIAYAKLYIRCREKEEFMEQLSNHPPSSFLNYLGEILPPLLNELQKAVSLSQLVSKFFELLNDILDSFPSNSAIDDITVQQNIIDDVTAHMIEFLEFFYTVIHYTSTSHGTSAEPPYLTAIFDFIFGFLMQLDVPISDSGEPTLYHEKIKVMVNNMNTSERDALWNYISLVANMNQNGLDERHWPKNDTIELVFVPHLRKIISNET
jgi:hypothetical protein